jgi:hypothetical protein
MNAQPTPFDRIADAVLDGSISDVLPRVCGSCPAFTMKKHTPKPLTSIEHHRGFRLFSLGSDEGRTQLHVNDRGPNREANSSEY